MAWLGLDPHRLGRSSL